MIYEGIEMTEAEAAQVVLFRLSHLPIQERLDALASELAKMLGEGHTRHSVLEAYAEEMSDLSFICRDIALKIVEAQP